MPQRGTKPWAKDDLRFTICDLRAFFATDQCTGLPEPPASTTDDFAQPLADGWVRRHREVVLAHILHDQRGFGSGGLGRIADLLGARPGFGIAGHHKERLAL